MKPHDIRLGSPSPMKLNALSIRIAEAIASEPVTMIGEIALGRICRSTTDSAPCPWHIAAWTNSRLRRRRNSARVSRASGGQLTAAIAKITLRSVGPSVATSRIARMKPGMVWNSSVTRIRMSSTRPA